MKTVAYVLVVVEVFDVTKLLLVAASSVGFNSGSCSGRGIRRYSSCSTAVASRCYQIRSSFAEQL